MARIQKIARLVETVEDAYDELNGRFEMLPQTVDVNTREMVGRMLNDCNTAITDKDEERANELLDSARDLLSQLEAQIGQQQESAQYQFKVSYRTSSGTSKRKMIIAESREAAALKFSQIKGADKVTVRYMVNEGPFDFVRGAGRELGSKVSNSRFVQGARDVVQAGKTQSVVGDLNRIFKTLSQKITELDTFKRNMRQAGIVAQQASSQNQQQGQQQSAPNAPAQQPNSDSAPNAFRTQGKPRGRMDPNHGFMYNFESYIAERFTDFAKGAIAGVAQKIDDKISQYGSQPSHIRDIYNSGRQASELADRQRAKQQGQVLLQDIKGLFKQAIQIIGSQGENGKEVLKRALTSDIIHADRIVAVINRNAPRPAVQTESVYDDRVQKLTQMLNSGATEIHVQNASYHRDLPEGMFDWGTLSQLGIAKQTNQRLGRNGTVHYWTYTGSSEHPDVDVILHTSGSSKVDRLKVGDDTQRIEKWSGHDEFDDHRFDDRDFD